ncbi:phosphoribosylglycinamide synthetase [Streptomyces sp. CB02923]|uniref:ATP-grasp domain-containing protein n=1 Tax=Streptomyces sp. CB02923 TaxID=1718985 RepID=UPI00093E5A14|nr:ATP-grasp domain-containing protein [Streptomyces sp. CB02923]OKI02579.1 phosphoribosylglycinamide synthetase [Streptomyces sp. CB02923]
MPTVAPVAVIVDGYYNAAFYPAAFARHGVRVIHVQSTADPIPSWNPPDPAAYEQSIVHTDDETTLDLLKQYDPLCVIAGQEPGVPLADRLSEGLGLPTNGSRWSEARRNKFVMTETLRAAGVRSAEQHRTDSAEAAVRWATRRGVFPVVVKPLSSCNADGVRICATADEVRRAADEVLASRDAFDLPNTEVLVQEYLDGEEYVVDTVSRDGQRFVNSVWKYEKTLADGKNLYDREILLPADEGPATELIPYVLTVLDALNIRHGAAHSEVKLTSRGPVLVETGARLNGGMLPSLHDICLGQNQADLAAMAFVDPAGFLETYAGKVCERRRPAICYMAATTAEGVVQAVDEETLAAINALPSVHRVDLHLSPGQRIRPTVDAATCAMRVYLTGPTQDAILADYARVRTLKDSVYRL